MCEDIHVFRLVDVCEFDALQCRHYMVVHYARAFILLCVILPTFLHLKEQRVSEFKNYQDLIIIASTIDSTL